MGYQVGRICHETAEQATNEVMTQVVPTIDKDGVLHHPVFNGQTWTYNEQTVKLQLPQCDSMKYYRFGEQIGTQMMYAMIAVFAVVVIVRLVLWQRERNEE